MAHGRSILRAVVLVAAVLASAPLVASGGLSSIVADDLRTWLTRLSSDELQGRATYGAGLGLAAGYIQQQLASWGVEPAGDAGAYLQTVRVLGVKATGRSSVTVQVAGQSRTFRDGEGVTFPRNQGARRTLQIDRVEFAGYGLDAPTANHMDFQGRDVAGAAVIWLGLEGPDGVGGQSLRRLLTARNRYATEQLGALAGIGPRARPAANDAAAPDGRATTPDFTTAGRLDRVLPPNITASDEFFEFLFSRAPQRYSELKRRAEGGDPLAPFRLDDVRLTFELEAEYEILRTELTHNVVGLVEGTDPDLRSTYVAFGAHYDHVGYATGALSGDERGAAPGRVSSGASDDHIWNGADDNGSGVSALLAVARAFAQGPRPRRSLLFVWHAGEERGLLGSRYFVDHPTVPLDRIVAHLNADMIGRNRDNRSSEADTVYVIGSDRISTELHEINRDANRSLPQPLRLDYELNDPNDLEQFYFRSDHYSYASRGIPIVFYTTGLHPDYHANTDHVSKIEFDKLARIAQLIYATGARVANLDHAPVRDNQGPRAGKGTVE